jgi:3-hydroxyacyl-[acyl-carrier-protein] dehydratase
MRWLWIDRFLEFESGRYAKAVKCVSLAEDYLRDHFPNYPVLPNSLIVEGLAQTGGLLVCEHGKFAEKVILAKIPKVQFYCDARPGDTLLYTAKIEYIKREGAAVTATSYKGDVLQAEAEIFFVHLNAPTMGTFFSAEAFLSMMRVLGAYRVGRAADGSPLVPPPQFDGQNHRQRKAPPGAAAGEGPHLDALEAELSPSGPAAQKSEQQ